MRSAEAARDTSNMIAQSLERVETGVSLSQRVAQNFTEIADQVSVVAETMTEIAVSSASQTTSIAEISIAVETMGGDTQKNAATTEESASATYEMSAQAAELMRLVGEFQTSALSVQSVGAVPGMTGNRTQSLYGSNRHTQARITFGGADDGAVLGEF